MKSKVEALYLDWFNNFITLNAFAAYHGLSERKASRVIVLGKRLNSRKASNV